MSQRHNGPAAMVFDLVRVRIERALRDRVRYRYVHPLVQRVDEGYLVTSPCCSRNVDPEGGVIDIARIEPLDGGGWLLCARDHVAARWVQHDEAPLLEPLLDMLCQDRTGFSGLEPRRHRRPR